MATKEPTYRWTAAHERRAAEATTRVADAEHRLEEAALARNQAVREALSAGVPVATLAAAYRLTAAQVRQIGRD